MGDVQRLADVARTHGAVPFDMRGNHSRSGYIIRFRLPDGVAAFRAAVDVLGFRTDDPEDGTITVTVRHGDIGAVRRLAPGRARLTGPPRVLP